MALSNGTMRIGGVAVGVTGIAGRPLHDSPTVTGTGATTSANTAATSTVSWTYAQAQGDAQSQYRVYMTDTGETTTYFDTGWLVGTTGTRAVDMDTEGVDTNGTTVRVHTQVRGSQADSGGGTAARYQASGYADVAYAWGDPQCTITAPADGQILTDQTDLTVSWTFSDGGNTQSKYRVRLLTKDDQAVQYDSGWTDGAGTSVVVPFTFQDNTDYQLGLQLRNNYGVRST